MDPRFKTSFIPKKTFADPARAETTAPRISILTFISLLVFLVTVAVSVGVFFYQKKLVADIEKMDERLAKARTVFEPEFVKKAALLSKRIDVSKELLSKHISVTPIFKLLHEQTLKSVQFKDFTYELEPNGEVEIEMSGEAKGFESVALQSDVFADNDNIKNPVFEGLKLDQKGNVLFTFHATFPHEFVSYKENLEE